MLKKEKAKIFIDIDGVVGDFCSALEKKYSIKFNFKASKSMRKLLNLSYTEFKADLNNITFWKTIPVIDEVKIWIDSLNLDCYFCSEPMGNRAAAGRILWIKKHFPKFYKEKKWILTRHKHLLANRYSVLIDDYQKNIRKFQAAGGYGILYPAPWNQNKNFGIEYVKFELDNILINEEED